MEGDCDGIEDQRDEGESEDEDADVSQEFAEFEGCWEAAFVRLCWFGGGGGGWYPHIVFVIVSVVVGVGVIIVVVVGRSIIGFDHGKNNGFMVCGWVI